MLNEPHADAEQMLEDSLILPIKQPVKTLLRDVKIDTFAFFKTLAKGTGSYASHRPWNLPADAMEVFQAIKIEPLNESERAWLLIYKAMLRAATELVQPSISLLKPDESTKDALVINLDATLLERQVTIDAAFFRNPQDLDILKDFQDLIFQWLTGWGLEEERARTVVQRLPSFFVVALHEEWREKAADYTAVVAAFNTPFIAATEHLLAWERYYAILRKQVQEAMFEETFSLEQVYVPLRAYYEIEAPFMKTQGREEQSSRESKKLRNVVLLQETLNEWLEQSIPQEALRVISGGPGSGKSSFAKIWAADLTTRNAELRVLYVPLHNFNLKNSLEDAVGDFVRQTYLFNRNPLDPVEGEKKLLLIFDGLDEIAQRGRASTELARDFVAEVRRTLDQRNQAGCRVQALITGRELVVQSNSSYFRQAGQILHALSYKTSLPEQEIVVRARKAIEYKDDFNILEEDQRDLWWRKYGIAIGQSFDGIPEPLRREDMEDVTAQPLLNYLVALSYKRGALDFAAADINLNQIYADLLVGVHKRDYEGERNIHVSELSSRDFGRVLEEIALAVWHGNGRTATVEEIEKHCHKSGSDVLIKKLEEGAKSGVTRLLTAFYFREEGQTAKGERTFEFTHKTFGEYLTAKRIIRGMEKMIKELKERRESFDEGWNEQDALQEWTEICGPTELHEYVVAFLRREIESKKQETIKDWQTEICGLINALLKIGLPLERVEGVLSFKEMLRQSRNAEEALLVMHCLSASSVINPEASEIQWPNMTSALEWIRRLQAKKFWGYEILSSNLAYISFNDQFLPAFDFVSANLEGASFKDANLYMANLSGADLTKANLSSVDLTNANLGGADLTNANLRDAELIHINFNEATLTNADLRGADLSGANLLDADLSGAKMDHTTIKDSNLGGVDLGGVNLRYADLRQADLQCADLSHSTLTGANLINSDFRGADLQGADLRGVDFSRAIFDSANLDDAIIDGIQGLTTDDEC